MRPFFGYHMPNFTFPGVPPERLFDRVVELAQAAESAGFDLVTVMDHFYQIAVVAPEEEPMLEGYAVLSALAMRTSRVRLATMVSGVTYRNPALLAKTVTTLDVISKGRAVLGIGAAWNESEHRGLGFAFPPIRERMDRLEEALHICRAMFTEERPTFEGTHYRIEAALNRPRPLQPGGPKILIGGSGERRTLRLAAQYADITNWFGGPEEAGRKIGVLERHCEEVGRDPSAILRTVTVPLVLVAREADGRGIVESMPPERRAQAMIVTPRQAADVLDAYRRVGFGGFMLRNTGLPTPDAVGLAKELMTLLE